MVLQRALAWKPSFCLGVARPEFSRIEPPRSQLPFSTSLERSLAWAPRQTKRQLALEVKSGEGAREQGSVKASGVYVTTTAS